MGKSIEGLERFTESNSIDHKLLIRADSVELKESLQKIPARLKESFASEAAEGWWVPISFYNKKNGNGRVYNKRLWENVINRQKEAWQGAPMLADHPEGDSDGSPKDICGVWLDGKLGEEGRDGIGLVYGLLIPSGHIGEDLKDHLSKGLRIGTSSSGFGKLMKDGVTVDPDTYQIERLSDWVLNPSQGTFFSWDESNDIQDKSIRESQETNTVENIKEKVVKDSKITKLEEKKFRKDMESFLEDANKIKDPQERLEEFKEIRSYLEDGVCPDLKEKVESKIAEQEEFIKQALLEKVELKEEFDIENTKELKTRLTKISEDVNLLKTEAHDWKKISEKLQAKYLKAKKALNEKPSEAYTEYQKTRIKNLTEKLEERTIVSTSLLKELKEAYEKSLKEIEDLKYEKICEACKNEEAPEEEKIQESQISEETALLIEKYTGEIAGLKKKLERADAQIVSLANSLNATGNKYREANAKAENILKSFTEYKEGTAKESAILEKKENNASFALTEASVKIDSLISALNEKASTIEHLTKENETLREANNRKRDQLTNLTKELKEAKASKPAERLVEEKTPVINSSSEVDRYFEGLYRQYGNEILPYEKAIKKSITLSEAKKYFFRNVLQNLRETTSIDKMRLPENLYTTPEERIEVMNEKRFAKTSSVDRLPEGWL